MIHRGMAWLHEVMWEDEGEELLFICGISRSVHVFTLGMFVFCQVVFWTAWYPNPKTDSEEMLLAIALSFVIVPGITWWVARAKQLNTVFCITTHRLLIREGGYLGIKQIMIPWNQISSIVVDQSWYDEMFNRGKLRVSDTGQQTWEFMEVDKANEFRQHVLDAITPRDT